MEKTPISHRAIGDVVLTGVLVLFFIQLATDFFSAVYLFGLLGTDIPPEIVVLLVLFSPFLAAFARNSLRPSTVSVLFSAAMALRLLEPLLPTRWKMFSAGAGMSILLFACPFIVSREKRPDFPTIGTGIILGLCFSNVLRALGLGTDLSTVGFWQIIGLILAGLAAYFLFGRKSGASAAENAIPDDSPKVVLQRSGFGRCAAFAVGISAAAALLCFIFGAVNIAGRWTGMDYWLVLALAFISMGGFAFLCARGTGSAFVMKPITLIAVNLLFSLSFGLGLFLLRTDFPGQSGSYPFMSSEGGLLPSVLVAACLLSFPVLVADILVFIHGIHALRPSPKILGGAFGLSAFAMLLFILAQAFTTVYDYIPIIGPLFRDRYWLVHAAAALAALLPLSLGLGGSRGKDIGGAKRIGTIPIAFIAAIGVAAVVRILVQPVSAETKPTEGGLRVLTYNIQQGYNASGQKNYEGQLALMRSLNPDIIGLEECDTNRIAGSNDDLPLFLSRSLGMYSYYGPPPQTGTFGVALLSRYPIEAPYVFHLYSKGEQTAAVVGRIVKDGRDYTVAVTHLGNDGPMIQAENILKGLEGKDRVVVMGDFNFRPREPQFARTTARLADSWSIAAMKAADNPPPVFDANGRIDYIFVSPGLNVASARFLTARESDHPAYFAVLGN